MDRQSQGRGVGKALLRYVFSKAWDLHEEFAGTGVLVDAKPKAAEFYSRLGFERLPLDEGAEEAEGRLVPMFLPIRRIPDPRPAAWRTTGSGKPASR